MGLKRLLYFPYSDIVLAVLLGFGLATLFRKSCGNKSCIDYKGPDLDEIKKHVYNIDGDCYKFVPKQTKCSANKEKEVINLT